MTGFGKVEDLQKSVDVGRDEALPGPQADPCGSWWILKPAWRLRSIDWIAPFRLFRLRAVRLYWFELLHSNPLLV